MDIQTLLNDIENNEHLKSVFIYWENRETVLRDYVPDMIENPRWEGQPEIVKQINWLYSTGESFYCVIGVLDDAVWFMDSEGDMDKANFDIYNLPFHLYFSPFENDWINRKNILISFLYYFDYCEKNKIILTTENYQWKKQLQLMKIKFEAEQEEFALNIKNHEFLKRLFKYDSDIDSEFNAPKNLELPNVKWLFKTKDKHYKVIGVDGLDFCFIDGDGQSHKVSNEIFSVPFYLYGDILNLEKISLLDKELIKDFANFLLYCFTNKLSISNYFYDIVSPLEQLSGIKL